MTDGGIVAILFTDLVGSTTMYDRLGDIEAEKFRREHFALLRDAVAAHGGTEVKSVGDGLMVVFASAVAAVEAGLAIQAAARARNERERRDRLEVRVGVHVGEPLVDEADFFGISVNIARRLCDAARAGQTLVSDLVRALTEPRLRAARVTFGAVGELHLKGIGEPIRGFDVVRVDPLGERTRTLPALVADTARDATFSGRDDELVVAEDAWKHAATGARRLLLIAGEPGIGKTRLAVELARRVADGGGVVLAGRCDAELNMPLQPVREALAHVVDDVDGATQQAGDATQLMEALTSMLTRAASGAPVMLIVDDAHWADHATLLFVRHLMRHPVGSGLLVVLTYRDTDIDRSHPLAGLLADARREPGVARLPLRGLTTDDLREAIGATGSAADDGFTDLLARITSETEGNPFFALEVVRHLSETSAIAHTDRGWEVLTPPARLDVPEGVREVVGRRLTMLSDSTNAFLAAASILGRRFSLPVAAELAGQQIDEALDHVEAAVAAHVVSEVTGELDVFAFSHAIVRETLYSELSTARRLRLHLRAAEILQARGGATPAEIANHRLEAGPAGDVVQAAAWAALAADIARHHLVSPWDALRLAERGLEVLEGADAPELRLDLLLQKGDALLTLLEHEPGERVLAAAAEEALARRDAGRASRAVIALARGFGNDSPHGIDIRALGGRALELVDDGSVVALRLEAALQFGEALSVDIDLERCTDLLRRTEAAQDEEAFTYAALSWADAMASEPKPLEQLAVLERAAATALRWTSFTVLPFTLRLFPVHMVLGDRDAVDSLVERARGDAYRGVDGWVSRIRMYRATLDVYEGRLDDAERVALQDLEAGLASMNWAGPVLALVARERGQAAAMAPILEAQAATGDIAWRAGAAAFHAYAGSLDRVAPLADGVISALEGHATKSASLAMLADAAHAVRDERLAAEVVEALLPWEGMGTVGGLSLFLGAADRAIGRCLETLGDVDGACAAYERAKAFEARMRLPLLESHVDVDIARALLLRGHAGDRERAEATLAEAIAFASEHELPWLQQRAAAVAG